MVALERRHNLDKTQCLKRVCAVMRKEVSELGKRQPALHAISVVAIGGGHGLPSSSGMQLNSINAEIPITIPHEHELKSRGPIRIHIQEMPRLKDSALRGAQMDSETLLRSLRRFHTRAKHRELCHPPAKTTQNI